MSACLSCIRDKQTNKHTNKTQTNKQYLDNILSSHLLKCHIIHLGKDSSLQAHQYTAQVFQQEMISSHDIVYCLLWVPHLTRWLFFSSLATGDGNFPLTKYISYSKKVIQLWYSAATYMYAYSSMWTFWNHELGGEPLVKNWNFVKFLPFKIPHHFFFDIKGTPC